eukprot:2370398-Alexandrium_andersonii.AAC.1
MRVCDPCSKSGAKRLPCRAAQPRRGTATPTANQPALAPKCRTTNLGAQQGTRRAQGPGPAKSQGAPPAPDKPAHRSCVARFENRNGATMQRHAQSMGPARTAESPMQ